MASDPNQNKQDLEQSLSKLWIPWGFMVATAVADVVFTHLNISHYRDLYLEGNPIIRDLADSTNILTALTMTKISSLFLTTGVASLMELTEKYKGKGIYLLYMAGVSSAIGSVSNLYFYSAGN